MLKKLLLVALLLWPMPGAADSVISGNDLHEGCANQTEFGKGFCLGFIVGVARSELPGVCVPAMATNGQLRDIVVQFLTIYPDGRHLPARGLVHAAMIGAFACPQ